MEVKARKKRKPIPKHAGTFVLCKGEKELAEGTIEEIAEVRNVQPETIKYLLTNVYRRRVEKSKTPENRLCLIPLDYDLPDD